MKINWITAGTYTSSESKTSYAATVTTDIDYANTTVAFAVVWKPALVEDTVVVDYGLDVVVDVYTNDGLAAGVTGVSLTAPSGIEINKGTYGESQKVGSDSITSTDELWTASKENLTSVRFHQNEMGMNAPATFYYEAGVNYYTYDASNNATLNTTNMYSSVTVIPATTVYYEDDFIDLTSYTKNAVGEYVEDTTTKWTTVGTTKSATQDVDRPGVNQAMSDAYDANNVYGYDSAYTNCSEYSLGASKAITVDSSIRGEATFSFYGTGFDIIGLTSNTTGNLIVQTYDSTNTLVKTLTVNTYYGYAYGDSDNDGDSEWYTVESASPNALYQVPVMQLNGLTYGKYTVKLTAGYNSYFDKTGDGKYTLYLDAVRIYDPCGSDNETANNAYVADGEAYPEYRELRNEIITANTFNGLDSSSTESVSGIIFIDGATTDPDGEVSISDYTNYGPNNELYLAYGQAVAFDMNAAKTGYVVSSVQLAVKTVGGTGSVEVYGIDSNGNTTACLAETISTATDMYYDITELNGMTVVIKNSGDFDDAIVSLTNIKVTYTVAQTTENEPEASSYGLFSISRSSANAAIASLSLDESDDVIEDTTEKTTEEDTDDTTGEDTEDSDDVIEETPEEDFEDASGEDTDDTTNEGSEIVNTITNIVNNIVNTIRNFFSKWFR